MITVRTRNGKETFFEADTWAWRGSDGLMIYEKEKIVAAFPNGEWYGVDNLTYQQSAASFAMIADEFKISRSELLESIQNSISRKSSLFTKICNLFR